MCSASVLVNPAQELCFRFVQHLQDLQDGAGGYGNVPKLINLFHSFLELAAWIDGSVTASQPRT